MSKVCALRQVDQCAEPIGPIYWDLPESLAPPPITTGTSARFEDCTVRIENSDMASLSRVGSYGLARAFSASAIALRNASTAGTSGAERAFFAEYRQTAGESRTLFRSSLVRLLR